MDQLLGGLPFASAYIDDVVVFSQTWEDHLNHLRTVLTRLTEAGLTVKLGKCSFARKDVLFLGHLVSQGRITAPKRAKSWLSRIPATQDQEGPKGPPSLILQAFRS